MHLSKYFSEDEIAFKCHPGSSNDNGLIKIGTELPSFVPAEMLYSDNVKMYLTVSSYSIVNVEKGLAVSLVNLISFKDDITRSNRKQILIQNKKSKILFPESLDEFERILMNLKEQEI